MLGSTPGSFTVTATDGIQGSATVIAENYGACRAEWGHVRSRFAESLGGMAAP